MVPTKVIVTIDTEVGEAAPACAEPFNRYILGRIRDKTYGAPWIAGLLKQHGFPGVFFLDVYGSARFGAQSYPKLCDLLIHEGHDIELHTHPGWMYDSKRRDMHKYSLAEQIEILRDGISLLRKWTSKIPVAHRAGNYGANLDTLRALKANGIHIDSSFIAGRANCCLPHIGTNAPVMLDGIYEVPVTTIPEPIDKFGLRLPLWTIRFRKNYSKLDPTYMNGDQLCKAVRNLLRHIPYIVILLHSRSFIRDVGLSDYFEPDVVKIAAFSDLLHFLSEECIEVTTFARLASPLAKAVAHKSQ